MMAKKRRGPSQRKSILNYIAVSVIAFIGIILSVFKFNIPFTNYTYNGFARSISMGLDLAGGVSVVYDCSLSEDSNTSDLDAAIDATVTRLESLITDEYSEATITKQGSTKIRIEVPSVSDSDEIFELIGEPTPLYMTLEQNVLDDNSILGTDIKNVYASYDQEKSAYGCVIEFTKDGTKKFSKLTGAAASGTQKIYVYLGDYTGDAYQELTCQNQITQGSTFISGSFETYEQASEYALQIMSGTFNVELELIESSVVSATLGTTALKLAIIAGLIGVLVIMFIMWYRYGDFGWLANFALVIYMVLMLFFLQAISFVQLTLPGLAGIILSIGMAVDGFVVILERIRDEYKKGMKIPLATKFGFNKALWPILDSNITTIITSIVLYILGTASIKGFAITLLIGIVLSLFTTLVVFRFLVKWYLPLNSIKPNKLHLPKRKIVYSDTVTVEEELSNDVEKVIDVKEESETKEKTPSSDEGGEDNE